MAGAVKARLCCLKSAEFIHNTILATQWFVVCCVFSYHRVSNMVCCMGGDVHVIGVNISEAPPPITSAVT